MPPPPEEPEAASPHVDEGAKKKPRAAVTEAQRNLERLRELRGQQKKVLSDLRRKTRAERRRISALNKKASKVSLQELMEIACIKHQMLMDKGELPPADDAAAAASSTTHMTPGEAFAAVAAHAAKNKDIPTP